MGREGARRCAVALALLAFGGACSHPGATVSSVFTHSRTASAPITSRVTSLVVDADNANVDVSPGASTAVRYTEHWSRARPTVTVKESAGVLTVTSRCPRAFANQCWVDISADVPPAADVDVTTENGNVEARDMSGKGLHTRTTNGNVAVSGVSSAEVVCASTNGNLTLSMLRSPKVRCVTRNGNVEASLDAVGDVVLAATNGNIDATIPPGSYSIDAVTTNGRVSKSAVTSDATSEHHVSARTTNGNVTITSSS